MKPRIYVYPLARVCLQSKIEQGHNDPALFCSAIEPTCPILRYKRRSIRFQSLLYQIRRYPVVTANITHER